jgi:hypothetical protein
VRRDDRIEDGIEVALLARRVGKELAVEERDERPGARRRCRTRDRFDAGAQVCRELGVVTGDGVSGLAHPTALSTCRVVMPES